MAGRDDILGIFQGRPPGRPVVSIRMDLWHQAATHAGTLPDEVKGITVTEVEAHLGFAQAARYRDYLKVEFSGAREVQRRNDDILTTELHLPSHTLTTTARLTPDMAAAGMQAHIVKYPLETDEDYRTLIKAYESAHVRVDEDGFAAFDRRVGPTGLPMLILGVCPAHHVALKYLGYEKFYLDMLDRPDLLRRLIRAIEDVWRAQLWPQVAAGSACLLLHGAHFSEAMTPPRIFREHFAPYFRDFNRAMHDADKWVAFHSDADLGCLMSDVAELGFDCADCLATEPLVSETIEDYLSTWRGRLVAWGGLPSVIFQPEYPREKYERQVKHLVALAQGRRDLIIGASDNVMPGAEWARLRFLADAVAK